MAASVTSAWCAATDAGADAGVDAGTDAGVDAGTDAGLTDAGTDASRPDAGLWRTSLAACGTDAACPRVMAIGHGGAWDTSVPYNSNAALAEIRRAMGGSVGLNQASAVGRTLSFNSFGRGGVVEVTVSPSGAETLIRIDVNAGNLAGGIFGGIVGGVGGGLGPNVAWILPFVLHWPIASGIAAGAGVVGLTWVGCRAIFKSLVGGQREKMRALADALERQLHATR